MNCSEAWPPNAIQFFISSSGAAIAMLASMRFCISATMWSLRAVTSGSPKKARASAGVQSISTFTFI